MVELKQDFILFSCIQYDSMETIWLHCPKIMNHVWKECLYGQSDWSISSSQNGVATFAMSLFFVVQKTSDYILRKGASWRKEKTSRGHRSIIDCAVEEASFVVENLFSHFTIFLRYTMHRVNDRNWGPIRLQWHLHGRVPLQRSLNFEVSQVINFSFHAMTVLLLLEKKMRTKGIMSQWVGKLSPFSSFACVDIIVTPVKWYKYQ